MLVTKFVKESLAVRREVRDMERRGYRQCQPTLELINGGRTREYVESVRISIDGKHIWYKLSGDV